MISKPDCYAVPTDENLVTQFFYIHKPHGFSYESYTNKTLLYGGLEPTGPMPRRINFPLIPYECKKDVAYKVAVSGDPQTYSNTELGYFRDTLAKEVSEGDFEAFFLNGDVMGDDLNLYGRLKMNNAMGGTNQFFSHGNHDLDFDAGSDNDSADTFRREFGPEYYSFDIGMVHFVVLDNCKWPCTPDEHAVTGLHDFCLNPETSPTYTGVVIQRQLDWLANDLAHTPLDMVIFLVFHIPIFSFGDEEATKHATLNAVELYKVLGCTRSDDMVSILRTVQERLFPFMHTHTLTK